MEPQMFCYQCQETVKGTGCTLRGVCGKLPQTSTYMDLLIAVARGVGSVDHLLRSAGVTTEQAVGDFIVDALFATIRCAHFDDESIMA